MRALLALTVSLLAFGGSAAASNRHLSTGCQGGGTGVYETADRSPGCTPGRWVSDPNVTASHICAKGYNPRPSQSVTGPLKTAGLRLYGLPSSAGATTESDHLYPVWLGGATGIQNLWPERNFPGVGSNTFDHNPKDILEGKLYLAVCRTRTVTAAAARTAFEGDWRIAYRRYVGPTT